MDEYACCTVCPGDAQIIRDAIEAVGAVVFPLTGDRIGCMVILICRDFKKVGQMPFGGNPEGRIYVGIYGIGCCHHFAPATTAAGYFAEKLKLGKQDSETLAAFWGMMWESKPTAGGA